MDTLKESCMLNSTKPKCNCKDCPDHKFGCKDTCASWKEYEAAKAEWNKKREEYTNKAQAHFESNILNQKYAQKRKREKK